MAPPPRSRDGLRCFTADFVLGMNRAAMHASNLATLLRTYLSAVSLVDVVGGKTIEEAADRTRLDFASDGKLTRYSHPRF